MQLDRATARNFGQEYCGIIYSRGDGIYRVTYPSPLVSNNCAEKQRRSLAFLFAASWTQRRIGIIKPNNKAAGVVTPVSEQG